MAQVLFFASACSGSNCERKSKVNDSDDCIDTTANWAVRWGIARCPKAYATWSCQNIKPIIPIGLIGYAGRSPMSTDGTVHLLRGKKTTAGIEPA
jgi:hypothetical protein